MNASARAEHLPDCGDPQALIGLASLMTAVFHGDDIAGLREHLVARAEHDAGDANALMDLSVLMQLHNHRDIGLAIQTAALQIRRLYQLPATRTPAAICLLAIMAPGDISTNMPLEFLVQNTDVALDMLYLAPGEALPDVVPEHDVLIIAAGESDANRPLLQQLARVVGTWPRPVLNMPERILHLSRDAACTMLRNAPGIVMPVSLRIDRPTLAAIGDGDVALRTVLADAGFPIIARPVDSHAGRGLAKLDTADAIAAYLHTMGETEFYIARFVDYRSTDGLFRKYRIVLIDGKPYAGHMAVSPNWMIHYLNAAMLDNAANRAEEARFMTGFDDDFARRNAPALRAIAERSGLDYLIIDCAETQDGALLVFEVDSSAVVHAMDPVDLFPYKQPQMRKVFVAFHAMLERAVATPPQQLKTTGRHSPVARHRGSGLLL